jgi:hypothetical protein
VKVCKLIRSQPRIFLSDSWTLTTGIACGEIGAMLTAIPIRPYPQVTQKKTKDETNKNAYILITDIRWIVEIGWLRSGSVWIDPSREKLTQAA